MEEITQQELDAILALHAKWYRKEEGGKKADLSGKNLSRLNLHKADLRGAILNDTNLREADLSGANLYWADLSWADLTGANLRSAILNAVNLNRANLSKANLDFSAWALWCGSFHAKIDGRLAAQIITHLARCIPTDHQSECIIKHATKYRNAFCTYQDDVREL